MHSSFPNGFSLCSPRSFSVRRLRRLRAGWRPRRRERHHAVPRSAQPAEAIRTPEQAEGARPRVKALLSPSLSADRAVQIALLNNRDLQAAYNALGLSEAALVQASLPPNPTFALERIAARAERSKSRGGSSLTSFQLATLPARAEIAADRFRQAQFQAAAETLRIASEARRAFYRAVAAAAAAFLEQAREPGRPRPSLPSALAKPAP